MTAEVASIRLLGVQRLPSMAVLMRSNNETAAVSDSLTTPSTSTITSEPESVAPLRQARRESNLSTIASAGLHISRSRESQPQVTDISLTLPADRPMDPIGLIQNGSQVAREAFGATEKSQGDVLKDAIAVSDQMQIDSQSDNNATSLINTSTVASPGPIEDSASQDGDRLRQKDDPEIHPGADNKSFSYPMPTASLGETRRGLSLPDSGFFRSGQRSPSSKKHRCPYCATEFTRHHNLKSHLLTHSQEKPYVCQTCQSRFRRLHDLKRHTKLHTGERPHICPKCGRRFARGDALARHNKGQGGCAGRRASMGSYAGEDEYGDVTPSGQPEEAMEGLVYAEPERMDDEDERRLNMPSIKRHNASPGPVPHAGVGPFHPRHPSTYPPVATRKSPFGGLFPPSTSHGGSSTSPSPVLQTGNMTFPPPGHPSGASLLHPSSAAESSRPLSPSVLPSHELGNGVENAAQLHGSHLPSASRQFQQQSFNRPGPGTGQVSTTNHAASGLELPPPQPGAPHLPPPSRMNSSDSRFPLSGQGSMQPPIPITKRPSLGHSGCSGGPLSSKPDVEASPSLPGAQGSSSDQNREDKLWAYVRSMHEELVVLRAEVTTLKAHVASMGPSSSISLNSGVMPEVGAPEPR